MLDGLLQAAPLMLNNLLSALREYLACSKTPHGTHGTHGITDTRTEFLDAEMIRQGKLCRHHIEDADHWERNRVRLAPHGVDRRGPRRAVAPTEHVRVSAGEI